MILKCKMCGGDLDIQPGKKIAECMYCGSMQTVPNIDDERRANLFARAGQFRLNGEFDKAMAVYDEILRDDTTDAEAHWSMVLCKYGIDYVQDPKTRRRVPTVNRMQYNSVFEDADYIDTLKYADASQKEVYEIEANAIENIRNGILEISKKEKPFDIFISYKETDSLGRRTEDSVYAYDIYEKLTAEGYRVFFSRVTLESVVGTAYEPYIFAALNSAKVMLVVGTSAENMNSVWVRNEWSRYLLLMQQDKSKSLIPIYKDMNPYDLPAEFSYLQAQDANRIGFMQDIIRGIGKIIGTNHVQVSQPAEKSNDVENNIKRAKLALEDKNWDEAKKFCERILDSDAENGYAYLLLFMASEKVKTFDEIVAIKKDIEKNKDFEKAVRYSKGDVADEIQNILDKRNELENQKAYSEASKYIKGFHPFKKKKAAITFEKLGNYRDSSVLMKKVGESARKDNKMLAMFLCLVVALSIGSGTLIKYALPEIKYKKAVTYFENAQYTKAEETFLLLSGYKDSESLKEKAHIFDVSTDTNKEKDFLALELTSMNVDEDTRKVIAECIRRLISEKKIEQAEQALDKFGNFKSVQAVSDELAGEKINQLLEDNKIDAAISELQNVSDDFVNKQELSDKCYYMKAKGASEAIDIVTYGLMANGYEDVAGMIKNNAEEVLPKYLESGKLKLASQLFDYDIQFDNLEQIRDLCEQYKKYDVDLFVQKQGAFDKPTHIFVSPVVDLEDYSVVVRVSGFDTLGARNLTSQRKWTCNGDLVEINDNSVMTYNISGVNYEQTTAITGYIDVVNKKIDVSYFYNDTYYPGGNVNEINFVATAE